MRSLFFMGILLLFEGILPEFGQIHALPAAPAVDNQA